MNNDTLQPRHDDDPINLAPSQPTLFGDLLPAPTRELPKRPRDMTDDERYEHEHELRRARQKARKERGNPLIPLFGPGPEGAICRDCLYLYYHQQSKRWYKCAKRGKPTGGEATDHRVRWPACALFEQRATERTET